MLSTPLLHDLSCRRGFFRNKNRPTFYLRPPILTLLAPSTHINIHVMSYIIGTIIQQSAKIGAFVDQPRQTPAQLQDQQLRDLLWDARHTAFGLQHNFKDIGREEDAQSAFKSEVPAMDYQTLYDRWWSRAHLDDEPDVCWPGIIPYFALSSGTSQSSTKYLPLTEDLLQSMKRGSRRLFCDMAKYYGLPAEHYTKQMLMVGSCTRQKRVGYHWEGDLSGIMGMNRPRIMERSYRPGRHITDLPEWGERIERIAEEAPSWDIGFSVSNPMWLQIILEKIIKKYDLANINEMWPSYNVLLHGGVPIEPYKSTLGPLFGKPVLYMDSYGASEGLLAYQERPDHRFMKLLTDCGVYFEFVPFDDDNFDENGDLRSAQPRSLTLSEIETGKHYAPLLSTVAGAWRYLLGDTIQFTDTEKAELRITGRTKQFLSACGEHISIDNLCDAVRAVDERLRAGIGEFAVSSVREGSFWAHQWYLSTENQSISPETLVNALDEELCRLNDDYAVERRYALRDVRAKILPNQVFLDWLGQRGKLNGQAKIPRVLKGTQLSDFETFIGK